MTWVQATICHGIRLSKQDKFLSSLLTTFEASCIFKATGVVSKIASIIYPNNNNHSNGKSGSKILFFDKVFGIGLKKQAEN